jgi:site-specific DNA-cytosine methylase
MLHRAPTDTTSPHGELSHRKPLAVDLYCGFGGWTEGFLAEGWDVIGFDIERHRYPARSIGDSDIKAAGIDFGRHDSFNGTTEKRLRAAPLTGQWAEYPAQLVLQDVLTIHGSQFRNADCIVASPPCTEYSYMAMPWSRGKQIAAALREEVDFPEGYEGSRTIAQLNALFNACFRIQREACEAAGRHIPMVVENVKGAQPWVGHARWHAGPYLLWGDVPALMPHGPMDKGRRDRIVVVPSEWRKFAICEFR